MDEAEVYSAILERAVIDLIRETDQQLSAGVWHLSPSLVSALMQLKTALRRRGQNNHA